MSSAERPRRAATFLLVALLAVAAAAQQVADVAEVTVITPHGPQYGFPDPEDPTRFRIVFLGGVDVDHGTRHLTGETLVITLRRDTAAPAGDAQGGASAAGVLVPDSRLLEMFLEGHVTLSEGNERVSEASTYHFDNTTGIATIVQGELHAPRAQGLPPLAARFDRLRRLQDGTLHLDGFRYTNCSYGQPHWHVETPWAELRTTPEGRVLETGGNVIHLGDVPVFWLPGVSTNLDTDDGFLLRRVDAGRSTRFGYEALVELGGDASPAVSAITKLFGGPEKVDARWSLAVAGLSKRGLFTEPKLKYETKDSKGEIFGSYINDSASRDHLGEPITDHTRGRIDVQHRTHIDENQTLDIEVSRMSDSDYLKEYYEREFREDKPQETYVSYRNVVENKAFTVLGSSRLDSFSEQVEYQPELVGRVSAEPMLGGFLSTRAYFSEVRLPTQAPIDRNLRVGDDVAIDWPIDLSNGDRLRAQAGADLTWFDRTLEGDSQTRAAGSAGLSWSRAFHGTDSSAQSDTWNIAGLRRLADVTLGFVDRYYVSLVPDQLYQVDDVEKLKPLTAFTLQWRDRWQTHQDGDVRTILDTDWLLPVFPDQDRDNDGQTLGPLVFDSRWRPGANLVVLDDAIIRWRTQQNLQDGHYEESYASFGTSLGAGRRLHISNNRAFHEFNFVTTAVTWQLNAKWAVATYYQVDRRTDQKVRTGILLRQLAHCWYIDLELGTRRGESVSGGNDDETEVSISFTPARGNDEDLAEKIGGRYL